MEYTPQEIRRRPDGSIDIAHYLDRAHQCRADQAKALLTRTQTGDVHSAPSLWRARAGRDPASARGPSRLE